jgi:GT2 family glycosyltransferase
MLLNCIDRLLSRTDYPALEILTAAGDDTNVLPEAVARDQRVRRIPGRHPQWTNNAAEEARGSLLLLLDPCLIPNGAGWLHEMVSHAVRPGVGAVGAKLLSPEGLVRQAGIVLGGRGVAFTPFVGRHRSQGGYFGHLQIARDVTAVSGKCLMVQRRAFLAAGGLDEILSLTAFSDVDLGLKLAESGHRTVWTPYAELCLRDGPAQQRSPPTEFERGAVRMRERWGHKLDADRYWSPNLASDHQDVALAFPPPTGNCGSRSAAAAGGRFNRGDADERALADTDVAVSQGAKV